MNMAHDYLQFTINNYIFSIIITPQQRVSIATLEKQHKVTCTSIKQEYDKWKERHTASPDGTPMDTKEWTMRHLLRVNYY